MPRAYIAALEYCLPQSVLSNEGSASAFTGDWPEAMGAVAGVRQRRMAARDECASDLGFMAASALLESAPCKREDIDFIIFCSQTPDYFLPSTSCLLQSRLGLSTGVGAFDFTLGGSGYVQGLSFAKGLIETGQARNVLLITADTLTKFIEPQDLSARLLPGDAGAATLVCGTEDGDGEYLGPFVFGTDGGGAEDFIVKRGGSRKPYPFGQPWACEGPEGGLHMDGKELSDFITSEIPDVYRRLLSSGGVNVEDVGYTVFHCDGVMGSEGLIDEVGVSVERFKMSSNSIESTSSCGIPIAIKEAFARNVIMKESLVALVSFGPGYSWNAAMIRWNME